MVKIIQDEHSDKTEKRQDVSIEKIGICFSSIMLQCYKMLIIT